jgi:hypothetical protein
MGRSEELLAKMQEGTPEELAVAASEYLGQGYVVSEERNIYVKRVVDTTAALILSKVEKELETADNHAADRVSTDLCNLVHAYREAGVPEYAAEKGEEWMNEYVLPHLDEGDDGDIYYRRHLQRPMRDLGKAIAIAHVQAGKQTKNDLETATYFMDAVEAMQRYDIEGERLPVMGSNERGLMIGVRQILDSQTSKRQSNSEEYTAAVQRYRELEGLLSFS